MRTAITVAWLALASLAFAQVSYIPVERRGAELIQPAGPGEINWTQQIIRAKGWGVVDTALPNKTQARLMATRAAQVVAQRNLLEIVQGTYVQSETRVMDMMAQSDEITTEIRGVIRDARMIGEPVEKNGAIEVEMAVGIYAPGGVAGPIRRKVGGAPRKTPPKIGAPAPKDLAGISALAIDVSSTGIRPSLFPRIVDTTGKVLFDLADYYNPEDSVYQNVVRMLATGKDVVNQLDLGQNPYIIKALKAINSDVVVAPKEAQKVPFLKTALEWLPTIGKLLTLIF
jgi:hypothetical protein